MPTTFDKWLDDITNHLRKKQGLPAEGSDVVKFTNPKHLAHTCPSCTRKYAVVWNESYELYICYVCESEWSETEFNDLL